MEKRAIFRLLVVAVTLLAGLGGASAKKRHKPKPPKVSLACTTDDDCAFTAMADGDCCPSLCPPRVVSKTSAEALKKYGAECKKAAGGCPVPECAPPRIEMRGACVSGRCVARAAPAPARD